ncbi:uncharacterized protein LOC123014486 [Tribolium madens]|uniref:uncharacterized protein LOC123014486 n=1 Tax=Tribolium madens TaxID=41895 RepID=UPI001CF73B7E|nr:uncharacterized protein LOC123014486 [Tribolium madens]
MPGGRKSGRNTRRTLATAIESEKRPHFNPDDTTEPTAGEVVGVDGISGNKKHCSKPNISTCSSQFSIIKTTDHFVDKTKIIEVLFGDSEYVLITRPRRFGKSTMMNMVKEFVEKKVYTRGDKVGQEILRSTENDRAFPEMNLRLFEDGNLEISKWDEFSRHRGKYPTIYLDLQSIHGYNFLQILLSFRRTIIDAFSSHSYLLHCEDLWSTEEDKKTFIKYLYPTSIDQMIVSSSEAVEALLLSYIEGSLPFLVQVLHKHYSHGIYLFIDEYDAPINNILFENKDLCEKVNNLLTIVFKNLMKRQDSFIARALITGISYMAFQE